jgi:hypothetical protein
MATKKKSPTTKSRRKKKTSTSSPVKPLKVSELPRIPINVPPVWVDTMRLTVRAECPVVTLTFESIIPERGQLVEAVRLQTSLEHLVRMSKVLSGTVEQVVDPLEQVGKKD